MTESAPFSEWVILELMGHRRLAGYLTEQEIAGRGFLRLDTPADIDGGPHAASQLYNPSSVYCITPTTEAVARAVAASSAPRQSNGGNYQRSQAASMSELLGALGLADGSVTHVVADGLAVLLGGRGDERVVSLGQSRVDCDVAGVVGFGSSGAWAHSPDINVSGDLSKPETIRLANPDFSGYDKSMDIEAIISQLNDNDQAARNAYRAMNITIAAPAATYRPRHTATELVTVDDGFAVYAGVQF